MSKKTEALKLALEALKKAEHASRLIDYLGAKLGMSASDLQLDKQTHFARAITAIREALAEQPAQHQCMEHGECFGGECIYPAPQPAQQEQDRQIDQLVQERDHRDEIIDKLCDAVLGPDRYEWSSQYFFEDAVREVEEYMAALEQPAQDQGQSCYCPECERLSKKLDAIKAQQQEPVAEITAEDMGRPFNAIRIGTHFYKEIPPVGTKLYTSPPASKPWVGLTDEDKVAIYKKADDENWHDQPLLEAVEAKLKEKNA